MDRPLTKLLVHVRYMLRSLHRLIQQNPAKHTTVVFYGNVGSALLISTQISPKQDVFQAEHPGYDGGVTFIFILCLSILFQRPGVTHASDSPPVPWGVELWFNYATIAT